MQLISSRALFTIPLIYLGFGLLLFLAQHNLIYLPDDRPFGTCAEAPETTQALELGDWRGYYTPSPSGAEERLLVFYHGNAGNACLRTQLLPTLQTHDHAVIIVEYPGFADPDARPSTRAILDTIPAVQAYIDEQPYTDITVLGESIGSGFASYHADTAADPVDLILLTPFARLSDRAQEAIYIYPVRWLLREDLLTAAWAQAANQVTVIAAENDEIMPRRHTDRVVDALPKDTTEYHIIPSTNHNSLYGSPRFQEVLRDSLALPN